jgi:nucleotide-binding universal stress UspA family protein
LSVDEQARLNGTVDIIAGSPAHVIVEHAQSLAADLIVMGTHGRGGMAHLLLGSVAERIVRTAACPVLTIRSAVRQPIRRILVPTDFSATSDAALEWAELLAQRFGATLQLLHVLADPFLAEGLAAEAYITEAPPLRTAMLRDAQTRLDERAVKSEQRPVPVDTEALFGHGAKTVAEYAANRDVDLIVMGTHGRTGIAHLLLGSFAEKLVRTAPCPVLTVRHEKPRPQPTELVYDVGHLPA